MKKLLITILSAIHTPSLNEVVRKLVIGIEIPLLGKIFQLDGAELTRVRGSVTNPITYHFLLSDLDFSIVAETSKHNSLQLRARWLKKFFVNLGELEIYTTREWKELEELANSPLYSLWIQLNLVRKTRWQEARLAMAQNPIEKKKQLRGLDISLKKLASTRESINGQRNFLFNEDLSSTEIALPYYSHYLERLITVGEESGTIWFENESSAKAFIAILPDNDIVPDLELLREIKHLILQREVLQTHVSLRVKRFEQTDFNPTAHEIWLQDLERRKSLLLRATTLN